MIVVSTGRHAIPHACLSSGQHAAGFTNQKTPAKDSQLAMRVSPPMGVIGPNARFCVSVIAYSDPENSAMPDKNSSALRSDREPVSAVAVRRMAWRR